MKKILCLSVLLGFPLSAAYSAPPKKVHQLPAQSIDVLPAHLTTRIQWAKFPQPNYSNEDLNQKSRAAIIRVFADENGNVLDVYIVDPKTGTGTDSSNVEVNLPQTGNNSMTNWLLCVGAALFMAFGFGAVKASGVLKRKEDE